MIVTRRTVSVAAFALLAACSALESPPQKIVDSDGPLVKGISYIGISVSDIDRTAAYFKDAGGLHEVDHSDLHGAALDRIAGKAVSARTRTLRSNSGQIRLMQFERPSAAARAAGIVPVQGPGITHVCFQSPDNKPIFPKFVAAGAKPLSRTGDLVQLRPDVPVKYAYLRDWDATMIEIEQLLVENLAFDHRMRHVAIAAVDIYRTVAFFTKGLGKAPPERRSNLVNKTLDTTANLDDLKLNVAWFQVGNLELEIWQYLNPAPKPASKARPLEALGHNMIVFEVSDPAAALMKLQEAGGVRVSAPSSMDGGEIAFGRDPDGNLIGFFRPGSDSSPFAVHGLVY